MYNGKELTAKPGTRVAGWGCAAILFPCEGKRSFFSFSHRCKYQIVLFFYLDSLSTFSYCSPIIRYSWFDSLKNTSDGGMQPGR